jgi:hypothetical protein
MGGFVGFGLLVFGLPRSRLVFRPTGRFKCVRTSSYEVHLFAFVNLKWKCEGLPVWSVLQASCSFLRWSCRWSSVVVVHQLHVSVRCCPGWRLVLDWCGVFVQHVITEPSQKSACVCVICYVMRCLETPHGCWRIFFSEYNLRAWAASRPASLYIWAVLPSARQFAVRQDLQTNTNMSVWISACACNDRNPS